MNILYLASFVGGLLLAVRIMIFGVERPREEHPDGERSFRVSPPMIGAFLLVFGLIGYILSDLLVSTATSRFVIAAVLGVGSAIVSARLVRRWWAVTPEHEVEDERYILQGHLARVTKSIHSDVDGEVAFELGEQHRVLRARSLDDMALAAGTDVVIDRIEDEVAYVESWIEVEKRL